MDDQLADLLEQCLQRVERGATVDECLAAYPAAQTELELPLHMAAQLGALPRPVMPAPLRASLEANLLKLAAERRAAQAPANSAAHPAAAARFWRWADPSDALLALLHALGYRGALRQPWLRLAALAIAIVLTLLVSAGVVVAANAVIKSMRADPPTALSSAQQITPVTLNGPIEQIAQERWVVGGRAILLDSQTSIQGTPRLGALAIIRGTVIVDGALLADSIAIEDPAATLVPTAAATATLAPTAIPAALPVATAAPTTAPIAAPAVPERQPAAPAPSQGGGNDQTCQGQQRGRDDKKCDPNPHANQPPAAKPPAAKPPAAKPPAAKHDDKKKDGKGRQK